MGPKTGPEGAKRGFVPWSTGQARRAWEHRWIAQTPCPVTDADTLRACLRMLDVLEELDDVRSVTSNREADEALMDAALS